jgi:D-threo-aldose 1-dehydrogenase
MTTRRTFLAGAGLTAAAAAARPALASPLSPDDMPANPEGGRYRPPWKIGMGGGPMANGRQVKPEREILEAVEAAWDAGMRYFDTSPWYGLGLGERRFGLYLHDKPRDEFVISTKIGRVLTPDPSVDQVGSWMAPGPFDYEFDFTAEGTRRSVEDSLHRLGMAHLDIVFIHDLEEGQARIGNWEEQFEIALDGAMPELERMKQEGLIKAWGMGVNRIEPAVRSFREADPDILLLATQYSLMEHERALDEVFPVVEAAGGSIVVGAPLNNGFLSGRDRYNYGPDIPEGAFAKRARLSAVCHAHEVDMRTAALQFTAAPDVVSATIPGSRNLRQSVENAASMTAAIPADFWAELKSEGLIAESAPVPA